MVRYHTSFLALPEKLSGPNWAYGQYGHFLNTMRAALTVGKLWWWHLVSAQAPLNAVQLASCRQKTGLQPAGHFSPENSLRDSNVLYKTKHYVAL